MIPLTRLNRTPLYLNSDLIEHVESTPDTVITLTSGNNLLVRETPDEIIDRIVKFRRRIIDSAPAPSLQALAAERSHNNE